MLVVGHGEQRRYRPWWTERKGGRMARRTIRRSSFKSGFPSRDCHVSPTLPLERPESWLRMRVSSRRASSTSFVYAGNTCFIFRRKHMHFGRIELSTKFHAHHVPTSLAAIAGADEAQLALGAVRNITLTRASTTDPRLAYC